MKMHDQVADPVRRVYQASECITPAAWAGRPGSLQDIADFAANFTGASGAVVALEKPSGEIVCAARSGETAPALGAVLNRSLGISAVCVRTSRLQRCADTENDPRVDAEVCRLLGIRSMVVLPLRRNGRVAGLLSVYSRHASKFDHRDVAGLEYLQSAAAGLADGEEAKNSASLQPVKAAAELDPPLGVRVAPASQPGAGELPRWLQPSRSGPRPQSLITALGIFLIAALALTGSRFAGMRRSGSGAQLPATAVMSGTEPRVPATLPTELERSVAENPAAAGTAPFAETGLGHVQSVQTSLGPGYARVTIELDRMVPYAAYRLDRPERIYFDLRNTRLAPGVRPRTDAVAAAALRGIRSSQYAPDVVRVVLDLNTRAAYRAEFQADPPRLVIEVITRRKAPLHTADGPAAAPRASAEAGAAPAWES